MFLWLPRALLQQQFQDHVQLELFSEVKPTTPSNSIFFPLSFSQKKKYNSDTTRFLKCSFVLEHLINGSDIVEK